MLDDENCKLAQITNTLYQTILFFWLLNNLATFIWVCRVRFLFALTGSKLPGRGRDSQRIDVLNKQATNLLEESVISNWLNLLDSVLFKFSESPRDGYHQFRGLVSKQQRGMSTYMSHSIIYLFYLGFRTYFFSPLWVPSTGLRIIHGFTFVLI